MAHSDRYARRVQRVTEPMTDDWDAELYRLVDQAERVFGKDALNGALMRA